MAKQKLIETENDVKAIIKKALDKINAWSYAPIQTGMGVHGIPDRIACVPVMVMPDMVGKTVGLFVAVEAKRPGRRGENNAGATGQQINILEEILDAGGMAMLADGENDINFLIAVLQTIDISPISSVDFRVLLHSRTKKHG